MYSSLPKGLFSTPTVSNPAVWRSWLPFLLSDLRYPGSRIRCVSDPDVLLVYGDDKHSSCLFVVLTSRPDPARDQTMARLLDRSRPVYVVAGTPEQHSVWNHGPYGLSMSHLHRAPSWIPSFVRETELSRQHALLPFVNEQEIRVAVSKCHNAIHSEMAKDPAAAFDVVSLVIAAKIMDEVADGATYRFWSPTAEPDSACANSLAGLLADAATWLSSERRDSIAATAPSRVRGRVARAIFDAFQRYSFRATSIASNGTDMLGIAYETMVGATFRGELGSYFTPRTIADFMVRMLDVRRGSVFDPACGSAGLLIAALRYARAHVDDRNELEVYGNDLNPRMVQAGRVNFLVHGVDHRRVRKGDGLELPSLCRDFFGEFRASTDGFLWNDTEGPFDFILANPPFAGRERNSEVLKTFRSAATESGKPRSLNRTIPFLEVMVASLREGGMAGVVIPTSILNAEEKSFQVFREQLLARAELMAIIGLPEKAFVHTDCGIHGALLFFRRESKPRADYDVFVGWANQLGYDRLGRPTRRSDLPELAARYASGQWRDDERVSVRDLVRYQRWDPAWLRAVQDLPDPNSPHYVALSDLMDLRNARWSRRSIETEETYQYFEVADCDSTTGQILRIHRCTGTELLKKGRIRNRVIGGDILLPNHRDSLIGANGRLGRSCVVVENGVEGVLTTDRFHVVRARIDPVVLLYLLNSAAVRRQMVAHCRGAASLEIRPSILSNVRVPKALTRDDQVNRINAMHKRVCSARVLLEGAASELDRAIQDAF